MIVRIILSMALLVGVYTETGIWTTIFGALLVAGFELAAWKIVVLSQIILRNAGPTREHP